MRTLIDTVCATSYKLKVSACEQGSAKHRKLMDLGVNYLYGFFSACAASDD